MSNHTLLLHGLRHVLVYASLDGAFPPQENSPDDVALLRAANLAMSRKSHGVTDTLLFVIVGSSWADAANAVSAYGFSEVKIVSIACELEQEVIHSDYDDLQKEVGKQVANWLAKQHPGAIAFFEGGYDVTKFWWTGIEHDDNVFNWPFAAANLASELPDTHIKKAETWLTLLGHATDLHATQASMCDALGQQRAAVLAATLCEWLHGFEAVSGNSYNHFDQRSTIQSFGISDYFLGFEASRISRDELDAFCDEHAEDVDSLGAASLALITRNFRYELRNALSSFFGGDAPLFWALYSAIWPRFDQPMLESLNELLGSWHPEDLAELEAPWLFVTEGWSETADA